MNENVLFKKIHGHGEESLFDQIIYLFVLRPVRGVGGWEDAANNICEVRNTSKTPCVQAFMSRVITLTPLTITSVTGRVLTVYSIPLLECLKRANTGINVAFTSGPSPKYAGRCQSMSE